MCRVVMGVVSIYSFCGSVRVESELGLGLGRGRGTSKDDWVRKLTYSFVYLREALDLLLKLTWL